jgi:hypothetical protein
MPKGRRLMFGAVLKTAPFPQFYAAGRGGPGLAFETWVFLPTVLGLKRYQDKGHLHFVTFCCYRREAHLEMTMARDLFEDALERMRQRLIDV